MFKAKLAVVLLFVVAMVYAANQNFVVSVDAATGLQDSNSEEPKNKPIHSSSKQSTAKQSTQTAVKEYSNQPVVSVYVKKSERIMQLLDKDGDVVKQYHIALGDKPQGHKEQEGDERTPEGTYVLDYKNENSIAHRSMHISYPNVQDKANAQKLGVSPGGAIMIHGQMNGYEKYTAINQKRDWTDGCVAVTNEEMDEIMDLVKVGTPIKIEW